MEKSVTAILINCTERKESDYLVRLFSAEGVISAVMRGVRKPTSKLKFAAQPLAFCVYELRGNDMPIVSGAEKLEDFSHLTLDVDGFSACCVMLEAADAASKAVDNSDSFISLLKCFRVTLYEGCDARIAAIKFLQKLLFLSGFYRPEKSDGEIDGVKSLLSVIAGKYLADLREVKAEEMIIDAALADIGGTFSRIFDCEITSLTRFTRK